MEATHICGDLLLQIEDEGMRKKAILLLKKICTKRKGFLEKPAAKHMHHAYVGGLVQHTQEVIEFALKINAMLGNKCRKDDVILAAFLHDLGKLYVYHVDSGGRILAINTPISEEALVYRMAMEVGLLLNIDVISAIEFSHGGWSDLAHNKYISPRPLHAIIHSADLLSSVFGKVVLSEEKSPTQTAVDEYASKCKGVK